MQNDGNGTRARAVWNTVGALLASAVALVVDVRPYRSAQAVCGGGLRAARVRGGCGCHRCTLRGAVPAASVDRAEVGGFRREPLPGVTAP